MSLGFQILGFFGGVTVFFFCSTTFLEQETHKMGPEPIVTHGVTWGPLQMAENKWASLGEFWSPSYNW